MMKYHLLQSPNRTILAPRSVEVVPRVLQSMKPSEQNRLFIVNAVQSVRIHYRYEPKRVQAVEAAFDFYGVPSYSVESGVYK
ncbi:hypothetical protein [Rummeliibacillus suwonensis]|uniref:hypothetical protein n=1 Tax=Rummeliibacillus suwonensis TaxID=1306154 RepID=UPI0028A0014F|nr:hypothetical protein [Rummeliibacillus suwonensis]